MQDISLAIVVGAFVAGNVVAFIAGRSSVGLFAQPEDNTVRALIDAMNRINPKQLNRKSATSSGSLN
jgi:hypothetical protein